MKVVMRGGGMSNYGEVINNVNSCLVVAFPRSFPVKPKQHKVIHADAYAISTPS